jgi:hypothetical protein
MMVLVFGGFWVGSHWLIKPQPQPVIQQSGFIQVRNPYRHTSQQLLRDVRSLQKEAGDILADQGYAMLTLANGSRNPQFSPRRDPFAGIASPSKLEVSKIDDESRPLSAAKILAPVEKPSTLSQGDRVRRISTSASLEVLSPEKVASAGVEIPPRKPQI